MDLSQGLTPESFVRFLTGTEIPFRHRFLSSSIVEEVVRFGRHVGCRIDYYPTLERGMDHARAEIATAEKQGRSYPSGSAILAGTLSGGKGRFARFWHAPPGGVWLTLALANTLLPRYANFLPLAGGVSCAEALAAVDINCRLKWVNDVQAAGRKIAGILTEGYRSPLHGEEYLLLGIGINVNNDCFPPELATSSVSVRRLLGRTIDLADFTLHLLAKLVWNIGLLYYEEREDLAAGDGSRVNLLLKRWKEMSDTVGRRVLYGFDVQKKPLYEATVLDVDEEGGLVMLLPGEDRIVREVSGEIVYLDEPLSK